MIREGRNDHDADRQNIGSFVLWEQQLQIREPLVLTLSVFTGAWGGSTTLSPDSAGLVRRVAGLVIVYWAGGWLLARDFDPLWLFVGPALAAVVLVIIGLWDGQLVLDARRLGGAGA